jgi:hypothetical protein
MGEQGRLDERHVACAKQDRALVPARAQRLGAGNERNEGTSSGVVDGGETRAGLGANREDWVRYLRERARYAHGKPDAAEVDRGFVSTHTARLAPGKKEACRVTWLDQITTSLAEQTGVAVDTLELSPDTRRALLDIARIASHSSGERIYAPLLCYVLGMLSSGGIPLAEAISIVEEQAGSE